MASGRPPWHEICPGAVDQSQARSPPPRAALACGLLLVVRAQSSPTDAADAASAVNLLRQIR
eukprot:364710-Chlamydomonas_euryale.AAC.4